MMQGKELFDAALSGGSDSAFWWLGQHSFLIRLGPAAVLVDPFLTPMPERNVPPLFQFFYHLVFEDVEIQISHHDVFEN